MISAGGLAKFPLTPQGTLEPGLATLKQSATERRSAGSCRNVRDAPLAHAGAYSGLSTLVPERRPHRRSLENRSAITSSATTAANWNVWA